MIHVEGLMELLLVWYDMVGISFLAFFFSLLPFFSIHN